MSNSDLSITIRALDQASSTLNQLRNHTGEITEDMERDFSSVADKLKKIGETSLIAGGMLAAGLGFSVKKAGDFEQKIADVQAVTGVTGKELESVKNLAIEMGSSTAFNSIEAADGIEQMSRASLSLETIMNGGLKSALDLASAGGISVADSAEIASASLNIFAKDHLTVAQAANILAGADKAGATSISSLQMGLSQVGAVATGVGLSFKDTAATLAMFEKNGLKGSDAGTSLKTMLMNLQPRTKEQIETFKQLGIITKNGTNQFFDHHGKMKNIAAISDILKTKMSGMTDQQRQYTLETMFGSDAIRAANVLYKEGAAGLNKVQKEMLGVTAAQMAATKVNTFNGSMKMLNNEILNAGISLGTALIPAIKTLASGIKAVVSTFNKFPAPLKNTIAIFGAISAVGLLAFGGLAIAASTLINSLVTLGIVNSTTSATFVSGLAKGVLSATRAFIGFNAALLTNPITWVVVGVVALVAGTVLLIKNWDKVTSAFNNAYTAAKNFFSAIGQGKDVKVNASFSSNKVGSSLDGIPNSKSAGPMPKYDVGSSMITRTGKAIVHKGEKIIPAGSSIGSSYSISFSPSISITGNSGNIQEEVERALNRSFNKLMNEFKRKNERLAY